jgi:hypothetical protein
MDPFDADSLRDQVRRLERQVSTLRAWLVMATVLAVVALLASFGVGLVVMLTLFASTGPPPVAAGGPVARRRSGRQ